ncbi:MAG: carbohydrate-binding protein, partial [Armatimonadetes bacterium]|nr:carbohydrate-binding protein [Armatimonadota bacterium]
CDASPFPKSPWGRCTSKGNRLYLHIFDWPDDRVLEVPGLKTKVTKAYLLNRPGDVHFAQRTDGLRVKLPPIAPDLADTVLVLDLAGQPQVDQAVRPEPDGVIALTADRAVIHGTSARVETKRDQNGRVAPNIGYWVNAGDWVEWEMVVQQAGEYEVTVEWANDKGTGGNQIEIRFSAADSPEAVVAKLTWEPAETGSWETFSRQTLGTVRLSRGRYVVAVKPAKMKAFAVTNLRGLWLKPR